MLNSTGSEPRMSARLGVHKTRPKPNKQKKQNKNKLKCLKATNHLE